MNLTKAYIFIISVILSLDISSNFIFPSLTSLFALCRDLITLLFFSFIYYKSNFSTRSIIIFGVFLIAFYLLYGISYSAYVVRFYIYFMVFRYIFIKGYALTPLFLIPIFLMFAFFFIPNQSINQGFRFFSGNTTVIGLILLSLVLVCHNFALKYFSIISIFLTGSISAIFSFIISTLSNRRRALLVLLMASILPFVIPEGETSRRLSGISSILLGDFNAFFAILTLSSRTAQFRDAIDHADFNFVSGLPPQTFVGEAGIESQLLHFISFGGLLGIMACLALVVFFIHQQRVRFSPSMFAMLLIMLLTIRILESAGAVVAFVIIINFYTNNPKRFSTNKKNEGIHTDAKRGLL